MNWLVFIAVLIPTTVIATRWAARRGVENYFTEERCRIMVDGYQCSRRLHHRGRCR